MSHYNLRNSEVYLPLNCVKLSLTTHKENHENNMPWKIFRYGQR